MPPVTKPLSPSATEPVPNFSLHFLASSVEMLEASLLALTASLVSTVVDNSVNLGAIAPVMASLDTFTLYTVELPSTRLSTEVLEPFSSLTASLDKLRITVLPSSVMLSKVVLALALNLESNALLMLEVALLTALVIAVLTVPPVTKPLSPSATEPTPNLDVHSLTFSSVKLDALVLALVVNVLGSILTVERAVCKVSPVINPLSPAFAVPVPNFSLHFLASSVEMLEASLLALTASLVSTVVDNSVNLGAIAPVMASLDTFTLYTVELPSTRLSTEVLEPFSSLTASLDKLRITVLPSSVMLSKVVLALAFNVLGSILTVERAACKVSPVISPVLPAAFVPFPNAACQAVLLIAFASDTFHN